MEKKDRYSHLRNRGSGLDTYRSEIIRLLRLEISVASIAKLINEQAGKQYSYPTYFTYIKKLRKAS